MNIIPEKIYDTGNYLCTWRTQNTVLKNKKLDKLNLNQTRDSLCEEFLFGNPGILSLLDNEIKKDLIIVLDDGWDVDYGLKPSPKDGGNEDYKKFGSMLLNEKRFPSFDGSPKERLKKLSDKIKEMGRVDQRFGLLPGDHECHADLDQFYLCSLFHRAEECASDDDGINQFYF